MSSTPGREPIVNAEVVQTQDEGGLRPPDHLQGWRRWWWWFDFVILVKLARLRFIAILVVIGIVITQWELLVAYYKKWTRPADVVAADPTVEYFCPMHPAIVRDNPKEKCPICFMPLAKRKKGSGQAEALPAGVVNRVQLTPYRVVLAGVETTPAAAIPLSRTITAVGTIEFNERGQKIVSARIDGRIDKLLVNETGRMVEEGQVLALLYSPELTVTIDNLLQAQRRREQQYVDDAKERLRLLGIHEDQIAEILRDGKKLTHVEIRAPLGGHVIQKFVKEGQYVEEGMALYEVADLSTVWIQAQVYEDDMGILPLKHNHELAAEDAERIRVTAQTRAFPGEVFEGRLAFIFPHLDETSRTVLVRFELDNPDHRLRPGSTATVKIEVPPAQVPVFTSTQGQAGLDEQGNLLAVPESAVIDTGSQKIVYRQVEPGVFEGVLVELGPKMKSGDGATYYPVLKGLEVGERIVSSGSFLVDAETRLNPAAGSIYFGGSGGAGGDQSTVMTVRPTTPDDPEAKIQTGLAGLFPQDRELAEQQRFCPVLTSSRLGSMGTPIKLVIRGETVFICCEGCRKQAIQGGDKTIERAKQLRTKTASEPPDSKPVQMAKSTEEDLQIAQQLAKLSPADRALAERQKFCVVADDSRLGSMGPPVKIMVEGEPVLLCCEGCEQAAKDDPKATLAKLKELRTKTEARKESR